MSRSFGPIDGRADFYRALDVALAYARSPDFWLPTFAPTVQRQLGAIRAWTANAREPLFAERTAIDLPRAIYLLREDLRVPEPAEFHEKIELTRLVAWYFASWPPTDDLAKTASFMGAASAPRVPERRELEIAARAVADSLDACAPVEPRPPDAAFQSKQPLARDSMTTTQWIRWVLLPRLDEMVVGTSPIPERSHLCTLAMHLADDESLWPVLYALGALDDLFHIPIPSY